MVGADSAALFAFDEVSGMLRVLADTDRDPATAGLGVRPGEGVAGRAFARRELVVAQDYSTWPGAVPAVAAAGTRVVAAVPLLVGGRAVGAISVSDRRRHELDPARLEVLGLAAAQVAPALEAARLFSAERQAREAAELAEQRLRTIADSLLEAVYEADLTQPHRPSGVLRYYSANVEQVLGYPVSDWLADDALWVKRLHPDDRDFALQAHDALRERGETLDIEYRWIKPDGTVVWIEDRARIERGPGGEPLVLRGSNADVTQRKRLEQQLRQSEEEARAYYEAARALSGERTLAARLERILDAALALVGATQARVALVDEQADVLEIVAARGAAAWSVGTRQPKDAGLSGVVLRENRPLRCPDQLGDPRTWDPDAARRDGVRAWLGVPLADREGAFGVLIVLGEQADSFSAEDEQRLATLASLLSAAIREARLLQRAEAEVSERRRAEAELREREARLAAIVAAAALGIALVGTDGRILSANPALARILGCSEDELRGVSFAALTHADHLDAHRRLFDEAVAGARDRYELDARYRRADGAVARVHLAVSAVRGEAGRLLHLVALIADVTERVRQQERREALLRLARRLAGETDQEAVWGELLGGLRELLGVAAAAAYRWDSAAERLTLVRDAPLLAGTPGAAALAERVARSAAERRAPARSEPASSVAEAAAATAEGEASVAIGVPLLHEGRLLGALVGVGVDPSARFGADDAETLEILAGLGAATLSGFEGARMQGALLAARTAAHHINNQLALTVGYAELLARQRALPEALRPMALEALRGAEAAVETVAKLQRIARLEEAPAPLGLGGEGPVLDLERSSAPPGGAPPAPASG